MSVCAILLSYKRPQNIERILGALASSQSVDHIILSNNNPDINMSEWVNFSDFDIEFIQQPKHSVCAKRFEIALTTNHDYFIFPDDDLFLTVEQIDFLIRSGIENQEKIHGMFGQIKNFTPQGVGFTSGIKALTCEVDILNRVYCFSRAHLERMVELSTLIGLNSIGDALHIDDLLLSFCGKGRPVCHAIGDFEDCPTSEDVHVATYAEAGFDQARLNAYKKLSDITQRV